MSKKISFLVSLPFLLVLLLYLIAYIQLISLSLFLNTNPGVIGIQTERNAIIASLEENNMVPKIVITEPEYIVRSIAVQMSGEDNLYAKYVLRVIPQKIMLPTKDTSADMLLMDNILFITDVNQKDLEAISPVIGHLFVKSYFGRRSIKEYPEVRVMDKDAYRRARRNQVKKKIEDVDIQLKKINDGIKQVSSAIQRDNDMIGVNQDVIEKAASLRQSNKKISIRKKLDKEIAVSKKNIVDWAGKLHVDQKLLEEYRQYADFYKKQKSIMQQKEEIIPYELGIFEAEKSIKVALRQAQGKPSDSGLDYGKVSEKEEVVNEYLTTLVHEYLHYTSYISKDPSASSGQGKKLLQSFFEEGLTEYFARKVLEKNAVEYSENAYPMQTKIITEMMKKIPEDAFEEIYFEKDEKRLETILDTAYGKGFYKNNQIIMQTLEYTSDPKQALTIANEIMKKMGGEPIKEISNIQ